MSKIWFSDCIGFFWGGFVIVCIVYNKLVNWFPFTSLVIILVITKCKKSSQAKLTQLGEELLKTWKIESCQPENLCAWWWTFPTLRTEPLSFYWGEDDLGSICWPPEVRQLGSFPILGEELFCYPSSQSSLEITIYKTLAQRTVGLQILENK